MDAPAVLSPAFARIPPRNTDQMTDLQPPDTLTGLSAIVEMSIRADNEFGRDCGDNLTRIANAVAAHGARYALAHGWKLFCDNPGNSRKTGIDRIADRSVADLRGCSLGAASLRSLAAFGARRLIDWVASARKNQLALVKIGAPLPYWADDDNVQPKQRTLEILGT